MAVRSGVMARNYLFLCDFLVMNQKYFNSGNNNNNNKTELSFLTGISASHYMKGLLEVEPLHFTCHSTSDGTRVERVDSGEYRLMEPRIGLFIG